MSEKPTSFNLNPDQLARLWQIGTDDNIPEEPPTPIAGDKPVIPGYELLNEIGRGGMGIVWKALQLSTQRKVALKVMNSVAFGSDNHLLRFEREVELTARLNHSNIARIYDSGLHHGWYFYAMELIDGRPLDEYVRQVQPSAIDMMVLSLGICQAINHAHQIGIIHRDLKPSNILVSQDKQPHVVDFGLAKLLGQDGSRQALSISGEIKGTPSYMSPEQATGHIDQIDVRSDIYSLGVIMYEMLTGQPPYLIDRSKPEELYRAIRLTEPQRPRKLNPHFDSDLEAILLKTLEKEPHRRYQSVPQLIYDIECWLNNLPIVAKSASSVYVLRKLIFKHRFTSSVVTLLLVILISSLLISLYFYNHARNANLELQHIANQWHIESSDNLLLARHVLFMSFLQAWHSGNLPQARASASWLSQNSMEFHGASFLLRTDPLPQRLDQLRQILTPDQAWFADYMLAQDYLKNGNPIKALASLRIGKTAIHNAGNDPWYVSQIQAAIDQLSSANSSNANPDPSGKEDP